jgi:hypothetical protein
LINGGPYPFDGVRLAVFYRHHNRKVGTAMGKTTTVLRCNDEMCAARARFRLITVHEYGSDDPAEWNRRDVGACGTHLARLMRWLLNPVTHRVVRGDLGVTVTEVKRVTL